MKKLKVTFAIMATLVTLSAGSVTAMAHGHHSSRTCTRSHTHTANCGYNHSRRHHNSYCYR